ncbi:MAG: FAD-binding oxidoreductase [Sphaerobacter sp.]|nr:FAD-binding oxidoreductase [Sphaerobacter sp.]
MAATYELVIVGAGNLGLWTAYHLARRGFGRVAICERHWAGFGATSRSAGMIRAQGGSETAVKLGRWSLELYQRLGAELGLGSGFFETGYYILAATEAEERAFRDLLDLRRRCGVENEWVDPAEGKRRFSMVDWDRFRGAVYTPHDGYVHPPIVARNITYAVLREESIDLLEDCLVGQIEPAGSGYRVHTTRGVLETGRVLNAGGPRGARAVAAMLDIEVPVSAARHQIITFPQVGQQPAGRFPLSFALAEGIYVRPEEQGALLGMSNPEERADPSERYQLSYDWAYHERMRPVWEAIWPPLAGQPISRAWAASIDYTPDHLPIIDEPREGFFVLAAGGHGMMWGPGLGLKMAELIDEGTVTDLPAEEIRLARFRGERKSRDAIALPFPEE